MESLLYLNIQELISNYGYIGIATIVFLESGIFFALPGDSLLFMAGLLATTVGLNIWYLVIIIFISAFSGGILGYYLGTQITKLHKYKIFQKILKQEYIDHTHAFLDKNGLSAMLISRFLPIVRTFLPVVAGIVKMNYGYFIKYSLISSAIWTLVFTLSGYFLVQFFPDLEKYVFHISAVIVFLTITPLFYKIIKVKYFKN
jgi:membrane-associated protein